MRRTVPVFTVKCPACQSDKSTPLFLPGDQPCQYEAITENMGVPQSDPVLVGLKIPTDAMQGQRHCKKCDTYFWFFYSVETRQMRTATKEWLERLENGETAQHEGSGLAGHDSGTAIQQVAVESPEGSQAEVLQGREQEAPQGDKQNAPQRED